MIKPIAAILLALCMTIAAGCSALYMKGTPFYTGEFSRPQGPPEERVNLWPLLYYHDPALSVLWPVGELTDTHFAIRPVYSVYNLDRKDKGLEHNVVWPLAQFDYYGNEHRIFPAFWGKAHKDGRYFVLFPFVWFHSTDAYAGLWPLYIAGWDPSGPGRSHHVLWPVFHYRDEQDHQGWRVWPLYGDYQDRYRRYRFFLWPLGHDWRRASDPESRYTLFVPFYWGERVGRYSHDALLPLFWRSEHGDQALLITPLYYSMADKERGWRGAFPLFFQEWNPDGRTFLTALYGKTQAEDGATHYFPPLLSAWGETGDERRAWLLAPLFHGRWGGERTLHWVMPFYYYDSDGTFVTPLYGRHEREGRGWGHTLGPVFFQKWLYSGTSVERRTRHFLWPFGKWEDTPIRTSRRFWPLFWREAPKDKSRAEGYFAWPFYHYSRSQQGHWTMILPLFSASNHQTTTARGGREDNRALWVFPNFWNASRTTEVEPYMRSRYKCSAWPFWDWERIGKSDEEIVAEEEKDFSLLLYLYDFRRRETVLEDGSSSSYIRRRLLWRFMHYEKLDGDTTLDLFPFITSDRREDGFRKHTFAWRLFRWERSPDGGLKVDLLFLPVARRPGE